MAFEYIQLTSDFLYLKRLQKITNIANKYNNVCKCAMEQTHAPHFDFMEFLQYPTSFL